MSDESVRSMLRIMRGNNDPRLPQYVGHLHKPDGWSLQQIGDEIGTSREWVRQLELRGYQEVAKGQVHDLTDLPTYTRHRKRVQSIVAFSLPPEMAEMLRVMNNDAMNYRAGKDNRPVLAFNKIVANLVDTGVPMNAIAKACGQNAGSFRRRMARYGIKGKGSTTSGPPRLVRKPKPEPEPEAPAVAQTQPAPAAKCKWPDCPSRTGSGPCIH